MGSLAKQRKETSVWKKKPDKFKLEVRHCFVSWFKNKTLIRIIRHCNKFQVIIANVSLLLYLNPHYTRFWKKEDSDKNGSTEGNFVACDKHGAVS